MDDVTELAIPDELFNEVAGYKPNARRQGFNVLRPELSARIITHFDLFSEAQVDQFTQEAFEKEIARDFDPQGSLDRKGRSSGRVEQGYHRRRLLGANATGICALCGEEMPRALLVAAHIKKRQHCSREERLDPAVVMLNCKLGCDAVYEEGFVTVDKGKVRVGKSVNELPALQAYVESLIGGPCEAWKPESAPYFKWHQEKALSGAE
ncbi:MAG: hypothetical protein IH951_13290 [Bacteroidetes bacterium]|nr:hypothetical protein [Bacteroidota bacterium]